MSLDDLERWNRVLWILGDFGLRDTFQGRIAQKPIEIDMELLRIQFSALNVDFDGSSLDVLGSRKRAHKGIKDRYPRRSRYFTVVDQFFWKRLQIGMGNSMLPITTSISDELFSCINIDDFERS